jgi:alpha-beta hydrolase superfamily lysophospholipase
MMIVEARLPRWRVSGLLLAAGALLAAAAPAQEPVVDAGLYRLYQSGAELGRETFRRTATTFESSMELPVLGLRLVTRVGYDAAGHVARCEVQGFNLAADTLTITYEAVATGDSLHFTQIGRAGTVPERRWSKAAVVDGCTVPQSVAGLLSLVDRAQRRDTTYRAWGVGEDSAIAITVAFHGDSAQLTSGSFELVAVLSPAGRVRVADIPIQRVRIERWEGGDTLAPLPGLHRPPLDYSVPPDAPYTAEEVRVPVRPARGDTFSLAGTLTVPKRGAPPFPAAVMITGSGLQDRDENLWPLVRGYRPFRQIAERLAEAGIAVLRVDDRGFGGSGGNAREATTEDFAGDVAAEVAWLRQRPGIDAARIALIGHSEGGLIAPMLAARDARIAAIVLMAGTAKTGVRVLVDQVVGPIERAPGLAPQRRAELEAEAARGVETDTAPSSPWLRWFRSYDPLPTARLVKQPVLILQGAVDRQVSAGQADTLAEAMRAAGNPDVTERVFPHLNHLFLVSPTDGSPSEYPALKDTSLPRVVLDTIADWLARRLAAARAGGAR